MENVLGVFVYLRSHEIFCKYFSRIASANAFWNFRANLVLVLCPLQ